MAELGTLHLEALSRLESRLASLLRDLRIYRQELTATVADKGVLGSRGLTEYLLLLLRQKAEGPFSANPELITNILDRLPVPLARHQRSLPSDSGLTIRELMALAEQAGYAVPTRATLAKRLNNRAYSAGDVRFEPERGVWKWTGSLEINK